MPFDYQVPHAGDYERGYADGVEYAREAMQKAVDGL